MTRRETILAVVSDAGGCDLLCYDRKEDEDLPLGSIEAAIEAGEITVDEIVKTFRDSLVKGLGR